MTLSDHAARVARGNERFLAGPAVASITRAAGKDPKEAPGVTDPIALAEQIAEKMLQRNTGAIDAGRKAMLAELYGWSAALDNAAEAFEKSGKVWEERAGQFLQSLRSTRMAVTTEVDLTLRSLKDAAGFLRALDDQKAFALLAHLIDLGKQCREAFGEHGLARLADTLLLLSERTR